MSAIRAARIAADPVHGGALERDDVVPGVHADVAVLQQVFADKALMNARRDPRVGHDLARLAQTFLRLRRDELRVFDDGVLRLPSDGNGSDVQVELVLVPIYGLSQAR